ncbi:MAG: phosphatase PAP2 family protein [Eubacteriales bacterium]
MNIFNSFEVGILHSLHDFLECEFLDGFFSAITHLADGGIFWIILAVVLLFFKKTRRAGITMAFALILGLIFGNIIIKPLTARIRPYDFDTSIVLLIPPEVEYSFPSGHTLASVEGAVSVWLYHKKAGTAAIILAFLIAFSRLYLMVHYPLDVIAGALLGVIFAFAASKLADILIKKAKIPVN